MKSIDCLGAFMLALFRNRLEKENIARKRLAIMPLPRPDVFDGFRISFWQRLLRIRYVRSRHGRCWPGLQLFQLKSRWWVTCPCSWLDSWTIVNSGRLVVARIAPNLKGSGVRLLGWGAKNSFRQRIESFTFPLDIGFESLPLRWWLTVDAFLCTLGRPNLSLQRHGRRAISGGEWGVDIAGESIKRHPTWWHLDRWRADGGNHWSPFRRSPWLSIRCRCLIWLFL